MGLPLGRCHACDRPAVDIEAGPGGPAEVCLAHTSAGRRLSQQAADPTVSPAPPAYLAARQTMPHLPTIWSVACALLVAGFAPTWWARIAGGLLAAGAVFVDLWLSKHRIYDRWPIHLLLALAGWAVVTTAEGLTSNIAGAAAVTAGAALLMSDIIVMAVRSSRDIARADLELLSQAADTGGDTR